MSDYYLYITPIKKWDLCTPDAILRAHYGIDDNSFKSNNIL